MTVPRTIGAVSYLNTRPLIYGLEKALPTWRVELDLPSRLAQRLRTGDLAVGLVPVVELFSGEPYTIVSDACIACDGPVWSVKLLSRVPPAQIRSVALDEGSMTSVALVRLLLRLHWRINPDETMLPVAADWRATTSDAVLIIGDRAMGSSAAGFPHQWDLGEWWRSWSGLPFVFAVWAARQEAATDELAAALSQARDRGCMAAGQIARDSAGEFGLSEADCRSYLTKHLHFRLGQCERAGLEHFSRLAAEHGLVTQAPELRYLDGCAVA